MMLIENLIDFGLSEKEAKTYVAVLELEMATANEIARKSGVNRSSTYVVIESLKKQGLVSMTDGKTVKKYVATPPETLLSQANKRAEKSEKVRKMIEEIVPSLEALHKDTKHKPKVFVYEGRENVEALYYKELTGFQPKTDFRTFEDMAEIDKFMPTFMEKDFIERKSKGVLLRSINPNNKENQEVMKKYKYLNSVDDNQLIPTENFKFSHKPIGVAILEDGVSFYSLRESFAIVIKQKEIADALKNIFDLAWAEAKRLNQYKPV